ncbi:MAG: 50S ribosomal protein L11 methyltransferase [Nanoarchaeota archaeon]
MKTKTFPVGDLELVLLNTTPEDGVFEPNTITKLFSEYVINDYIKQNPGCSFLDLGCGTGAIAIAAKKAGAGRVVGVDIMQMSVNFAQQNAKLNNADIEFKVGNLFEPLNGEQFDCISYDVSAMAKEAAKISPWYVGIPSGGSDGTGPSLEAIEKVDPHMTKKGMFYLPYITLANYRKIVEKAQEKFGSRLKEVQEKPFPKDIPFCEQFYEITAEGRMTAHRVLKELKGKGLVDFFEKGSRLVWRAHMQKVYSPAYSL